MKKLSALLLATAMVVAPAYAHGRHLGHNVIHMNHGRHLGRIGEHEFDHGRHLGRVTHVDHGLHLGHVAHGRVTGHVVHVTHHRLPTPHRVPLPPQRPTSVSHRTTAKTVVRRSSELGGLLFGATLGCLAAPPVVMGESAYYGYKKHRQLTPNEAMGAGSSCIFMLPFSLIDHFLCPDNALTYKIARWAYVADERHVNARANKIFGDAYGDVCRTGKIPAYVVRYAHRHHFDR